jgi:hypothetical protein
MHEFGFGSSEFVGAVFARDVPNERHCELPSMQTPFYRESQNASGGRSKACGSAD